MLSEGTAFPKRLPSAAAHTRNITLCHTQYLSQEHPLLVCCIETLFQKHETVSSYWEAAEEEEAVVVQTALRRFHFKYKVHHFKYKIHHYK